MPLAKSKSTNLSKARENLRLRQSQLLANLALKYEKGLASELIAVTDAIALVDGVIKKEVLKLTSSDLIVPVAPLSMTKNRRA
jgi:hypothetical protein